MTWRAGFPDRFRFLDNEHEALVEKLKDVKISTGAGEDRSPKMEVLKFLKMLREHTKNEENIMRDSSFPERELHEKHHGILLESIETIIEFFDHASMMKHRESIVDHIESRLSEEMFVDRQLAKFLREQDDAT